MFAGRFEMTEQRNVGALMASQGMGRFKRRVAEAAVVTQDLYIDERRNKDYVTFVVRATVHGMGRGHVAATYRLNKGRSKRVTNHQSGISFFDRVRTTTENDNDDEVVLVMERVEVNEKFRLDVTMRLREQGRVMVTENIMTLLPSGERIEASRRFRRVENAVLSPSPAVFDDDDDDDEEEMEQETMSKVVAKPSTRATVENNVYDTDDETGSTTSGDSSEVDITKKRTHKKRSWWKRNVLRRGAPVKRAVLSSFKSRRRTAKNRVGTTITAAVAESAVSSSAQQSRLKNCQ